jgi:hypothetical protein
MHDFTTIIIVAFIGVGLFIIDDDVTYINVFDAELEELMVHMKLQVLEVFQKKFVLLGLV